MLKNITKEIWEAEKKEIRIPVHELSYREFNQMLRDMGKKPFDWKELVNYKGGGGTWGTYVLPPREHIFIYKRISLCDKMWVLAHERGHWECHRRACWCMRNDNDLQVETHAVKYALRYLKKKGYFRSLMAYLESIERGAAVPQEWESKKAYENVIATKFYAECWQTVRKITDHSILGKMHVVGQVGDIAKKVIKGVQL